MKNDRPPRLRRRARSGRVDTLRTGTGGAAPVPRRSGQKSAGNGPIKLLLAQFRNILVWVLMGAAIVAGTLGEGIDAIAIAAIVVLNIGIGFYQEYRAENAMSVLSALAAPHARVVRDGQLSEVAAATVAPGDLLVLEAGDLVPADARLLDTSALCVNEIPLTGESVPVEKHAQPLSGPDLPLAERANMVFLGTSVVAGRGRALVVETGMHTEMGRIALLLTTERRQTPLERRLNSVAGGVLAFFGALAVVDPLPGDLGLRTGGTAPLRPGLRRLPPGRGGRLGAGAMARDPNPPPLIPDRTVRTTLSG